MPDASSQPAPAFERHGRTLACDGVALDAVAAEHGTPLYVYSAAQITARYRAIDAAFADYPHSIHYALKANSTLAIARLLRSLGSNADANSGGEIDVALRAGFIPSQIVFTGVGKTVDELAQAIELGVKAINVESAGEIERIAAIAREQQTRVSIAFRVNPDIDARSHPHISTGRKTNKFGIGLDDVKPLATRVRGLPEIELIGLHAHVGSQITNLEPLTRAAATLAELARELRDEGTRIDHLDLGGGLGVSYDGSPVPDARDYATALLPAVRDSGLSIVLEPGRQILAPAGVLLARVVDVKGHGSVPGGHGSHGSTTNGHGSHGSVAAGGHGSHGSTTNGHGSDGSMAAGGHGSHGSATPGGHGSHGSQKLFVILDAGMTELIRPMLYNAFHRIEPVVQGDAPLVDVDVVGPLCESSDTIGRDRRLPRPEVGDLYAIMDTGAYGSVMASNYNRRLLPAEVLVENGKARLIRRRQTIDDVLALEF